MINDVNGFAAGLATQSRPGLGLTRSSSDGARIICRRSVLMRRLGGQGAMAVVGLPAGQVRDELDSYVGLVSVAACNSPAAFTTVRSSINMNVGTVTIINVHHEVGFGLGCSRVTGGWDVGIGVLTAGGRAGTWREHFCTAIWQAGQ